MQPAIKRTALVAFLHLTLTIASILASFGAGMARFDHPEAEPTTTEIVANALAGVLAQPVMALLDWTGIRGLPPLLQWLAFAANSLLWAGLLVWIAGKLGTPWQKAR